MYDYVQEFIVKVPAESIEIGVGRDRPFARAE